MIIIIDINECVQNTAGEPIDFNGIDGLNFCPN